MLDAGIVAEYAEAISNGAQFPPVIVYHDGSTHWLADGYHRIEAADEAKQKIIAADIRVGSRRDAILFACGANRNHGLRRTRADVRRAITTLVSDAEWGGLSNHAIAERVGCDHKTVGAVRAQLGNFPNCETETSGSVGDQLGNFPSCETVPTETVSAGSPVVEERDGANLAGIRQAAAMMKGETPPPAPPKCTGRDGKSYPTAKPKPAPKAQPAPQVALQPAPQGNKAVVAMQAAHALAAALARLEPLEVDLIPQDAQTVIQNLRTALARLKERFPGLIGQGEGRPDA